MKLIKKLNPENVIESEASGYRRRTAVRAVIIDYEGKIGILKVNRDKYYKLPGGGIESGEDHASALARECLEEMGCEIEVVGEIGVIEEIRKFCSLTQKSYFYIAKLRGVKGEPQFMDDEIEEGFEAMWLEYPQVVKLMNENRGEGIEAEQYIVPRDRYVVNLVKEMLV